jgi:hypothetical protein
MDGDRPVALIVAFDHATRASVGGWMEAAGFEVELCTGPTRPGYRCVADTAGDCPLTHDADLVILDAWLASDADDEGAVAPGLVRFYRSRGLPLIVLDHGREAPALIIRERTALIEWPPNRRELQHMAQALVADRSG